MPAPHETELTRLVRATLSHSRPLGAYTIAQLLSAQTGRRGYANTVYRVIGPLVAAGEVIPLACVKGWVLAKNDGAPALILFCDHCHHVEQVTAADAHCALQCLLSEKQFSPDCVHLEMIGRCAECR
jgi:Fur family zinc uptake transcriptional regulator